LSQLTLNDLLNYQTTLRKAGLANRTVNSYVVELLRPAVKQARKWGINRGPLADLTDDWRELKLSLPSHRTRSGSRDEMALLLSKLRKDYRPILLFALKSGLRRSQLIIRRDQVDWDNRVLRYKKKSKRAGDVGWLPLTDRMVSIMRNEIRRGGDSEWVFTFNAKFTRRGYVAKHRYPITEEGLKSLMQDAVVAAKLKDWRLIHDLRHTAATETLRSSQNLAAVQLMLGHSDIAQTSRYAHVLASDTRRAMETRR
jgi:integrase